MTTMSWKIQGHSFRGSREALQNISRPNCLWSHKRSISKQSTGALPELSLEADDNKQQEHNEQNDVIPKGKYPEL